MVPRLELEPSVVHQGCDEVVNQHDERSHESHRKSIPYIPMLAREGVWYNVGGSDGRGGLLLKYRGMNALQQSAFWACYDMTADKAYFILFEEFRKANLFKKEILSLCCIHVILRHLQS
jgi:hypothetical protein